MPAIRVSWDELHLSTLSGLLTRNTNFGRCFTKTLSAMTLSRTARSWLRWHPTRNDLSYHFLRPEDSENSDDPRVWTLQCQTARIGRPFITLHSMERNPRARLPTLQTQVHRRPTHHEFLPNDFDNMVLSKPFAQDCREHVEGARYDREHLGRQRQYPLQTQTLLVRSWAATSCKMTKVESILRGESPPQIGMQWHGAPCLAELVIPHAAASRSARQVCLAGASQIPATFCMSLCHLACATESLRKAIDPRDGGDCLRGTACLSKASSGGTTLASPSLISKTRGQATTSITESKVGENIEPKLGENIEPKLGENSEPKEGEKTAQK